MNEYEFPMTETLTLVAEMKSPEDFKNLPDFCRKNRLGFCFEITLPRNEAWQDLSFLLVKRTLKLFPFEKMRIEVEAGRVKDVFSDWDSYLEWFQAEAFEEQRLFQEIQLGRFTKNLGYLCWKKLPEASQSVLQIYTETDQSGPFSEACQQVAKEKGTEFSLRVGVNRPRKPILKRRIYDWAFSFLNSSVRRGTISKRSPTKP